MSQAVEQVWSRLGGLDMLVNNAGLGMITVNPHFMTAPQGFWQVPPAGFRAVVDTNLTGYFLMAREVTPRMLGPSRAGAEALSRIMAADLAGTGVTVNILLPGGATDTGMLPPSRPPPTAAHHPGPGHHGPAHRPARLTARPRSPRPADHRHQLPRMAGQPRHLTTGPGLTGRCCCQLSSVWLAVGEECQSDGGLKAGLPGRSRPGLVAGYAIAGDAVPLLERLDCRGRTGVERACGCLR